MHNLTMVIKYAGLSSFFDFILHPFTQDNTLECKGKKKKKDGSLMCHVEN